MNLDTITRSDTLGYLRSLPDGIVQTCITSPPYWGLRDYGCEGQIGLEASVDEWVAKMVEVFAEVRRVLREDGVLWLNLGDAYAHSGPCGGESPDGPRASRETDRQKQSLMGYRVPSGLKPKDLIGQPWRVAFALQNDGWYLRSDIIWAKPNPMPESVTDRPTKSHEYLFLMSKSQRYFYDADAVREPHTQALKDGVEPIADWRSDKHGGNKNEFHENPRYLGGVRNRMPGYYGNILGRNKRTVWTIPTEAYPEAHFATFPQKLVEPCILAGSKYGDTILDPFMGSGTTALVALRLNRHFLGCDLNPEYVEMANKRISEVQPQLTAI